MTKEAPRTVRLRDSDTEVPLNFVIGIIEAMRHLAKGDNRHSLALVYFLKCCREPNYKTDLGPGHIKILEDYGLIENAYPNGRLHITTLTQEVAVAAHKLDRDDMPVLLNIRQVIEMPKS